MAGKSKKDEVTSASHRIFCSRNLHFLCLVNSALHPSRVLYCKSDLICCRQHCRLVLRYSVSIHHLPHSEHYWQAWNHLHFSAVGVGIRRQQACCVYQWYCTASGDVRRCVSDRWCTSGNCVVNRLITVYSDDMTIITHTYSIIKRESEVWVVRRSVLIVNELGLLAACLIHLMENS